MKIADLITGGFFVLFSIYLMLKSAELPIGWIKGAGPGGGAFPFWLSLGMLICSILIIIQNWLRKSPEGQSTAVFMDHSTRWLFFSVAVSLTIMIGLIHIVGVYFSMPLFTIFYMRYIGKHDWPKVIIISLAIPVGIFLLFEKLLQILLPKGLSIFEPLYYIFY